MTIPLDKLHTNLRAIGDTVRGGDGDYRTPLEELRRELGLVAVRLSLHEEGGGERVVGAVPPGGEPPGEPAWQAACGWGGRECGTLEVWSSPPRQLSADQRAALAMVAERIAMEYHSHDLGAERNLREQILDGTPNGVLAVGEARQVLLMNQTARHFFADDETAETVCGSPIERYLPQAEFLTALQRVLDGAVEEETLSLSRGTGVRELSYLVRLFRLRRGEALGATLIIQNVTEQRRLDDHVQRMGRMASIGQLAAGVAHEIRNPLTGISITLDMLQEEPELSAEGREMVVDISREIDRLESLISGLLDFARPQPAKYRPMRLAKALEWHRTFAEQCRKKGVSCVVELGPNPKIEGDPERLKQLFLNLAINALDATESGGTVTLRTAISPAAGSDEPVRVEVADTGVGMSESTLRQVFDPFFTTKNEGTGLGLSIAHSIAEQHGGRIDVRSTPGRGTTVVVELPPHQKEKDT